MAGEGTGMSDAGVAAARGQLQGGATQGSEAGSAGDNRRGSLPNGQDSGEAVALVRQATPDPRTDARQAAPRAPDAAVAGVGAWAVRDLEGGRVGESGVEAGAVARGGRRDQTLYLGETQQGRVEGLLGEVLAKLEMQDARIEGVKREMMLKMVGAWVRGCMCAWVQGFGCVGACVRGAWVCGCVGARAAACTPPSSDCLSPPSSLSSLHGCLCRGWWVRVHWVCAFTCMYRVVAVLDIEPHSAPRLYSSFSACHSVSRLQLTVRFFKLGTAF